jgi:hypothetical protein
MQTATTFQFGQLQWHFQSLPLDSYHQEQPSFLSVVCQRKIFIKNSHVSICVYHTNTSQEKLKKKLLGWGIGLNLVHQEKEQNKIPLTSLLLVPCFGPPCSAFNGLWLGSLSLQGTQGHSVGLPSLASQAIAID